LKEESEARYWFPIANHDNNQHAANENLRLQNLWDAIDVYAGLFAELRNWQPATGTGAKH
jgi:acetylornithine deacetylase/succinyl-diaminopimelate desuccinylase-like protein